MTSLRLAAALALGTALSAADAHAAVLVVDCAAGPFTTIQGAVTVAGPGDTVAVRPCTTGNYAPFTITSAQRVHVVAADPQYPDTVGALNVGAGNNPVLFQPRVVVDGTLAPNASCVTIVNSSEISIHNLDLRGCQVHGVDIQASFGTILQSNRIWRASFEGVLVQPTCENFQAHGNLIAYSGANGILLLDTAFSVISDNQIGVNGANGILMPTPMDLYTRIFNNEIRLNALAGIDVAGVETRIERNDVFGNNTSGGAPADIFVAPPAMSPDIIGNDTRTFSILDTSGTADIFGNR